MKKLSIAILLVATMVACAPNKVMANEGGLFHRGESKEQPNDVKMFAVPGLPGHGETGDQPATPVGSGILALSVLGGAYLVGKKSKETRN